MNKLCVYTVVCGNYDKVNEVVQTRDDVDYICFTDTNYKGCVPQCWKHIVIKQGRLNGSNLNRYLKINIPDEVREYKYSIYVDGNIVIKSIPKVFFDSCLNGDEIALYEHYERKNIYDESNVCIEKGMDYYWKFRKQISRYNRDGFVSTSLYEANIIFRKHNEKTYNAMKLWWDEYRTGVKRDQISFVYSMVFNEINITSLGRSDVRFEKKYFDIKHHAYPKSYLLKKKVTKFINFICSAVFGEINNGKN